MSDLRTVLRRYDAALFIIGVVLVAFALTAVVLLDRTAPTRMERVDTLAAGPYVVEADGRYLELVDVSKTMVPDWRTRWTLEPLNAWRYAEEASALKDAVKFKGRAVALRQVIAGGAQ